MDEYEPLDEHTMAVAQATMKRTEELRRGPPEARIEAVRQVEMKLREVVRPLIMAGESPMVLAIALLRQASSSAAAAMLSEGNTPTQCQERWAEVTYGVLDEQIDRMTSAADDLMQRELTAKATAGNA